MHEILNLEQNGINITEAILSRNQADESARQGKILMAFTIATVIFVWISDTKIFIDVLIPSL